MHCFRLLLMLSIACAALAAARVPARAQSPAFDVWRQADASTRRAALSLARRAFDAYALRRETIAPPAGLPPCFAGRATVFVSAMQGGAPRCCMGTLYPTQPTVADEIIASAAAAAGRDHRFAPIKPGELGRLRLIVSLLSPPRPLGLGQLSALDPTRDGLVVQNGDRSGVVLSGDLSRPAGHAGRCQPRVWRCPCPHSRGAGCAGMRALHAHRLPRQRRGAVCPAALVPPTASAPTVPPAPAVPALPRRRTIAKIGKLHRVNWRHGPHSRRRPA